jgi:hypothetical protein
MRARIFLSRRSLLSRRSAGESSEGGCSMKITEGVRKYAAEQGISGIEARSIPSSGLHCVFRLLAGFFEDVGRGTFLRR